MPDQPRAITVRGVGRVNRRPDQAMVTVSVEITAPSASDAQSAASERMQRVIGALTERGIDPGDRTTQAITLDPVYDYRESGALLTGYRATQSLLVRFRRIEDLGPVIDVAVGAGATGLGSVSLGLADPSGAESEARSLAMSEARARAEVLARAAGVKLGAPLWITEGAPSGDPRPMMRMRAEMAAADTPVSEGSAEIVVEIEVGFSLAE